MATFAYFGFSHSSLFLPYQLDSNVVDNKGMDSEETF